MDLKSIYLQDIEHLESVATQFINGEMSKLDFKKHSGGLGVYAEDCGDRFMVRLRISSGVLPIHLLRTICTWATNYSLEHVHLTTRQTIQFHHLTLPQMIQLLKDALESDITTKGAGGDFPRNVAVSPLSGILPDEPFDVTPYSLMIDYYFMQRMPKYTFPRKLKIAFSNTPQDTAHATVQDVGFIATLHEGTPHFKMYLGGGLGKQPQVASLYPKLVPASEILYYIEAVTTFFVAEGDYSNKQTARIRHILGRLGEEAFFECFNTHLEKAYGSHDLGCIVPQLSHAKKGEVTTITSPRLITQKQEGLYSIYVHPMGGQMAVPDLLKLLRLLEQYESVELRLALEESFYITHLSGCEVADVLSLTDSMSGHTQVSYSVACIGKPICQIGILNSQQILQEILSTLHKENCTKDLLPSLHISGCPNSCGTHHIAELGFFGKKKRVDGELSNVYECMIEGSVNEHSSQLAHSIGEIKESDIPHFIVWLYHQLDTSEKDFTSWIGHHIESVQSQFMI